MPKPTIDEILVSLKNEVIFGRAYLTIATGVKDIDPVVLKSSPTFFGLGFEASLQMSQLLAARLYDKTARAVTIDYLLKEVTLQADKFKRGTPANVAQIVKTAEARIAAIEDILKAIRKRRNEIIAHLDPETVKDPAGLAHRAKLSIADLEKVFDETSAILNDVLGSWSDIYADLRLRDADDYKAVADLIAEAKHAQVDKWEKEFPTQPCPFPRPQSPRSRW